MQQSLARRRSCDEACLSECLNAWTFRATHAIPTSPSGTMGTTGPTDCLGRQSGSFQMEPAGNTEAETFNVRAAVAISRLVLVQGHRRQWPIRTMKVTLLMPITRLATSLFLLLDELFRSAMGACSRSNFWLGLALGLGLRLGLAISLSAGIHVQGFKLLATTCF